MPDDSGVVDDERFAVAEDGELNAHVVLLRNRPVRVAHQKKWETMLAGEGLFAFGRAAADADNFGSGIGKIFVAVAERTGFRRTACRTILRIEKQHDDFFADQFRQMHRLYQDFKQKVMRAGKERQAA